MLTESHADTGGRPAIVLESAGDIVMAAPNGRIHTQSMHRSAEVDVTGSIARAVGAAGKAPPAFKASAPGAASSSGSSSAGARAATAVAATKPFDCTSSWAALDQQAKQTCDSFGTDIRARNKKISSDYAKMYLQDKRLEWAGMAGYASKQVGCGMDACDNTPLAGTMKDALGQGNRAVYEEIYPVHQFYEKHDLDKLRECASKRSPNGVPPSVVRGFEKIDAGDSKTGSLLILQHEQHDVLQPLVFDRSDIGAMMATNQAASKAGLPLAQETKVAFSSRCNGQTEAIFTGSNPATYEQRWPFASKVGDTFDHFAKNPVDAQLLDKGLTEIYENGR